MLTYDVIKQLCKNKGVTVTGLEKELGFARGSLCKVNTSKPSMEKVQKLADYFGISSDYLMNGEEIKQTTSELSTKEKHDIKRNVDNIMESLNSNNGETLYYDGVEVRLTDETKELLRNALTIAMQAVKIENKEKYNFHKNEK